MLRKYKLLLCNRDLKLKFLLLNLDFPILKTVNGKVGFYKILDYLL